VSTYPESPPCPTYDSIDKCDDGDCRGWDWFNDEDVEACDTCERFTDDLEALLHVQGCAPCLAYLEAQGGELRIHGANWGGWDWLRLCQTGDPGCAHAECDTCRDSHCVPPPPRNGAAAYEVPDHKCTRAGHGS
jgi:hypothetical protein